VRRANAAAADDGVCCHGESWRMSNAIVLRGGTAADSLIDGYREKVFLLKCCENYTLVVPESFGLVVHLEVAKAYCHVNCTLGTYPTLKVYGATTKLVKKQGFGSPREYHVDLVPGPVEFSVHKPFFCCDIGTWYFVITGSRYKDYARFRIKEDERCQPLCSSLFSKKAAIL
jgi:hypothetical protein